MHRRFTLVMLLLLCAVASTTIAQEVRYFRENGVDYMETQQTVRTPVASVRNETRQQTVYSQNLETKVHETQHTVYTPVVEYRWEPRVRGVLNPFRPTTVQYELVPHTRWQAAQQTVRTPVTYRTVTPTTQTVQTPVRELGFATQTQVNRTALSPNAGTTAPGGNRLAARPGGEHHHVAPNTEIGGVTALDGDHPKQGWQTSPDGTMQR